MTCHRLGKALPVMAKQQCFHLLTDSKNYPSTANHCGTVREERHYQQSIQGACHSHSTVSRWYQCSVKDDINSEGHRRSRRACSLDDNVLLEGLEVKNVSTMYPLQRSRHMAQTLDAPRLKT